MLGRYIRKKLDFSLKFGSILRYNYSKSLQGSLAALCVKKQRIKYYCFVSKVTFSISDRLPGGLGGGLVEVLHVADEGGSELLLRIVRNVYPVQAKTTLRKINFYAVAAKEI